jgi:serine/threonine protein kinase
MATVWLARDLKHDREVALKVVRADRFDPDVLTRFRAEIRATAQLNHPNILPVRSTFSLLGCAPRGMASMAVAIMYPNNCRIVLLLLCG